MLGLHAEPLNKWRHAMKWLHIPDGVHSGGVLYLLTWRNPSFHGPLQVRVNRHTFSYHPCGEAASHLDWISLTVPPGVLRVGKNRIQLWCDSATSPAWSLALENGHADPQSFVSSDGGSLWRNERMGLYHDQRGEYVVRLRTHVGEDESPPEFIWEDPNTARLDELFFCIPEEIRELDDSWKRARALATWASRQWPYANSIDSMLYTPWDVSLITAPSQEVIVPGQVGGAIRMCVHYAVVFASLALACGIPARCVVCKSQDVSWGGHFVAEVWHESWQQWCMIDPNLDLTFIKRGRPLAVKELRAHRHELRVLVQYGKGTEFHRRRLGVFIEESVLSGRCFEHWGVWRRNDFISRPEYTPPSHGQHTYCECDIVWAEVDIDSPFGMFPWVADDGYFTEPPAENWLNARRHSLNEAAFNLGGIER